MNGRSLWKFFSLSISFLLLLAGMTAQAEAEGGKRVIVLGIDGMDWNLTEQMMAEGKLPNMSRLAKQGIGQPLGTSVPPLSPVAWSDFITGMDSGGHGIFDFIHRDPETMIPYLSTSRTEEGGKSLKLGKWQLPLSGGGVTLLRHGTPFWEVLEEKGVETTVLRIPANFPPSGTATRELSGMGTPDILGTYGTFSFYTSELFFEDKDVSGGEIYPLDFWGDIAEGKLEGPYNPYLQERTKLEEPFTLYVDSQNDVAKLVVGDEERILNIGEWSDWVPVVFQMLPVPFDMDLGWTGFQSHLHAMGRFYLRQVKPEVELYVSPMNFDPLQPDMPVSTPADYATDLAEAGGRFYTQGMPEDTKSLSEGVLSVEEFLSQAELAGVEIEQQYHYVLDQFEDGLLFYYFGNLDQISHMLWRPMDPDHPSYNAERDSKFTNVIRDLYIEADRWVGYTLDHIDDDTMLIVMSDHGFTTWRRSFHLNSWLRDNGYLAAKDPNLKNDPGLFLNVDWSRTKAYGLGLNGLYVNVRGRERNGIVEEDRRRKLMNKIARELLEVVDPATGELAITKVYKREEFFQDRGHLELGPDIVVGYAKMTRGSNESALGELTPEWFSNNTEEWSGDHGMDHTTVPGVLFANRFLKKEAPSLKDLAAAIMAEFGVEEFPIRD